MTTRLAVTALICLALAVRGVIAWADWRSCALARPRPPAQIQRIVEEANA